VKPEKKKKIQKYDRTGGLDEVTAAEGRNPRMGKHARGKKERNAGGKLRFFPESLTESGDR